MSKQLWRAILKHPAFDEAWQEVSEVGLTKEAMNTLWRRVRQSDFYAKTICDMVNGIGKAAGSWACAVKLLGQDGNAFMIMGLCRRAARKAGWSMDRIDAVMAEMQSGNYDHLLQVALTHFDVR